MSLVKALFAFDSGGVNLVHYSSEDFKKDPVIISGLVTAINDISKETLEGDIDYFKLTNGFMVIHKKFPVRYELLNTYLKMSPHFPVNGRFVKGDVFSRKLKENDYILGSSLFTAENKEIKAYSLNELLEESPFKKRTLRFFDYNDLSAPAHYVMYTPRISFKVANQHNYNDMIHTCIIYKAVNEESLFRGLLDDFIVLLKENIQTLVPAVLWGETTMVDKYLDNKIKELIDNFNKSNRVVELEAKISKHSELGELMREKINELVDILRSGNKEWV